MGVTFVGGKKLLLAKKVNLIFPLRSDVVLFGRGLGGLGVFTRWSKQPRGSFISAGRLFLAVPLNH